MARGDGNEQDYEADGRCDPLLREEVIFAAAPLEDTGGNAMSPEAQLIEAGMYKSMEHMSPAHLEGMEFDRKDLPCDMWGVAIMVLTRDLAEILNCVDACSHLTR